MASYGSTNAYPRTFGGGTEPEVEEHRALVDALSSLYDPTEDTESYLEAYAFAIGIGIVWDLNERLRNQMIPERMLEALTTWEEACRLRPSQTDSVITRRKRVAAKLRGLVGNRLQDIEGACASIGGRNFVRVLKVPTASQVNYWPGINPGPPGREYSTNRLVICIELKRDGLSEVDFTSLRERTFQALDGMLPSYMTAVVGSNDGGFLCNVGVLGETLL